MSESQRAQARAGALVGRIAELEKIDAALERSAAGDGGVVMISGEAGIGKTALLDEVQRRARRRGMLALRGACTEEIAGRSWGPFADALDGYLAEASESTLRSQLGSHAGVLAQLAPRVRARLSDVAEPPPLDAGDARTRVLDAVSQFLIAVAARTPLLLIVDDLHWADDDTLALFRHLSRRLAGQRISIVGTYREHEVGTERTLAGMLGPLRRQPGFEHLALDGLAHREVEALLQALATQRIAAWSAGAVEPALVQAMGDETNGNPFFVHSLLLHLEEEGRVRLEEGCWRSTAPFAETTAPEDVRHILRRRIDRLSPQARTFLRFAAAVGGTFRFDIVAAVSELNDDAALGAIDAALQARLIEPATTLDTYRFVHALIRQSIYAELSPPERAVLHRRTAETMERVLGAQAAAHAAEIADHYCRSRSLPGGQPGLGFALLAAERAESAAAWSEVATFLDVATKLVDPDDPRQPSLVGRRAVALAWAQRFEEAIEVAEVACDSMAVANPEAAADYVAEILRILWKGGSKRGRRLVAKGRSLLGDRRDRTWVEIMARDIVCREAEDDAAIGLPIDTPERLAVSRAIRDLELEDSLAFWLLGFDLPRSRAEAISRLRAGSNMFRGITGIYAEGLDGIEMRAARLQRDGALGESGMHWATAARQHNALGNFAKANIACERLRGLAERLGPESNLPRDLSIVRYEMCRALDSGWEEIGRPSSRINDDIWADKGLSAAVRTSTALLLARLGATEEALHLLGRALPALERAAGWAFGYPAIACEAALTLWALQRRDHLDVIEACLRDKVIAPDFRWPMVDARHSLACLCALRGAYGEASQWFASASAALDEQGARPLRAITDYDEALMHYRRGDTGDAARAEPLLEAALAQFRSLGMPGWIRRAEYLRRTGRDWRPGVGDEMPAELTSVAAPATLFVQEGESWRIAYDGREIRLQRSRGLSLLARLLRAPGKELAATELWAIDETGAREAASSSGQARVNVTRAIGSAMRKIAAAHSPLGEHLARTVRTGAHCAYTPDPALPIEWTVDE